MSSPENTRPGTLTTLKPAPSVGELPIASPSRKKITVSVSSGSNHCPALISTSAPSGTRARYPSDPFTAW
jgi:hypothetical protein